jgi:hypothetical protein
MNKINYDLILPYLITPYGLKFFHTFTILKR